MDGIKVLYCGKFPEYGNRAWLLKIMSYSQERYAEIVKGKWGMMYVICP